MFIYSVLKPNINIVHTHTEGYTHIIYCSTHYIVRIKKEHDIKL